MSGSQLQPFLKFTALPLIGLLTWFRPGFSNQPTVRKAVKATALFVALTSSLLFALALPTGSIDISDFWNFAVFSAMSAIPVLATLFARRISTRWLRIATTVGSSGIVFLEALVFLVLCIAESGCTHRQEPIASPDGRHLALIRVSLGSALDSDSAVVRIRPSWFPFARTAYQGPGYYGTPPTGPHLLPQVRWLSATQILIEYEPDPSVPPAECPQKIGEIEIICEERR